MARPKKRLEVSTNQGNLEALPVLDVIRVRGARVHNLRDVDIDLPRDQLVVITGVSGSGKSSLAFDTIYAEGQRCYIESLSVYARHFLDQLERPDVDLIVGLPPTVAIDQRPLAANARSTVGTVTEVYDILRLLYARVGVPHCPECGQSIRRQPPEQIVSDVLRMPDGLKLIVMAPLVRGRKGQHHDTFDAVRRAGLIRVRVDGEYHEIQDMPDLSRSRKHTIEAVVDRLVLREGIRSRLAESVDRALKLAEGSVVLSMQAADGTWNDRLLSVHLGCPACGIGLPELEPRSFSFNSPFGACPRCEGIGKIDRFVPELMIASRGRSLADGAIAPLDRLSPRVADAILTNESLGVLLGRYQLTRDTPLQDWPLPALDQLVGSPEEPGSLVACFEKLYAAALQSRRSILDEYRKSHSCPDCDGSRLNSAARAVTVGGIAIHHFTAMTVIQALAALDHFAFEPPHDRVGPPLVKEIRSRLGYLAEVGLEYLSQDRPTETLSGGELQRVRLAAQIGSGLVGACFIFDEPTTGLHPRDTERLLNSLRALRNAGNSLLVVEHDEAMIRAADWVVDLGPGAGPQGGRIVAQGSPSTLQGSESATCRFLGRNREGTRARSTGTTSRANRINPSSRDWIVVKGARQHNLKGQEVRIPLQAMTCITGVSGSGKSTLVFDILARTARPAIDEGGPRPGASEGIVGLEAIDKLIIVDQSPIGRNARSTPATYNGVFDEIRRVFARTREAKLRGYRASRFSFNAKGGRCEACQGKGVKRVDMQFLPDLFTRCEACQGKRFNLQTLDARFKGTSIGDVLELRVDEALCLFESVPQVRRGLEALHEVGLGYVTLGQSSTTLSGGEAQRIKLAAELGRASTGRTLFLLDEPTTGLHFEDVETLLRILNRIVDLGNTLVVIEHNLEVIRASDWVIDLGPEGGAGGGYVVAMGTADEVAASTASHTGACLRALL